LNRLRAIYSGVRLTKETKEECEDEVFSFFVNCHHIKDWLLRDRRLRISGKLIPDFIDAHPELKICGDLCNGAKHCVLDRKPRTGSQPFLAGRQFESEGTNGVFHTLKCRFTIISNGQFYDALELAQRCMALWDEFLTGVTTGGDLAV
jgi:hypothetical protein